MCKGYEIFCCWKSNEIRDEHASVLQADMNQVFSKTKKNGENAILTAQTISLLISVVPYRLPNIYSSLVTNLVIYVNT